MNKKYPVALSSLVVFVGALLATVRAAVGEAAEPISIEFTAVAWERPLSDLSIRAAAHMEKLEIPAFARSKVYRYSGSNPMVVSRNDQAYAAGHLDYRPVAREVTIPAGWKRVILLVVPTADGEFEIKPVRDDPDDFPLGTVRIMNVAGERLAIKTRMDSRVLESQQPAVFRVPDGEGQLCFLYAKQEGAEWKPMGSGAFPVKPTERCTVFIIRSESDHFQQLASGLDEAGRLTTYRMPSRAFQLFTIADEIGAEAVRHSK